MSAIAPFLPLRRFLLRRLIWNVEAAARVDARFNAAFLRLVFRGGRSTYLGLVRHGPALSAQEIRRQSVATDRSSGQSQAGLPKASLAPSQPQQNLISYEHLDLNANSN
jgi:hypothetical protein